MRIDTFVKTGKHEEAKPGAKHIKPHAINMPLSSYLLLDKVDMNFEHCFYFNFDFYC